MSQTPKLSIVATARNDDHGGNLLGRMQLFIDGLAYHADQLRWPIELVLVEWNPTKDRGRLADVLSWPDESSHLQVRVIEVPESRHLQLKHGAALPLFQMIAKNVGIRRARAEYILATNIDVMMTGALASYLANATLRKDRMYRVDRLDVDSNVPRDCGITERLAWCREHVIRVNQREGSRRVADGSFHRIYWKMSPRVALLELLQDIHCVPIVTRKRLHLNACGDFTLMHRDAWDALGGYPEWEMFSMHLDSLLCTAAHFAGIRERALPTAMAIYHIEHGIGSGWTPEGEAKMQARIDRAGIPSISNEQFHKCAIEMRKTGKPLDYRYDNWGMASEAFNEVRPQAAKTLKHAA